MVKVGINGFGRVGRLALRISQNRVEVEVVAVNDAFMDAHQMANLFTYDSTHGRYRGSVEVMEQKLVVDGQKINIFRISNPSDVPWSSCGVEYVIECTGKFTTTEKAAAHLKGGAKKVVISAPSADAPIFVMGVNEDKYDPATQHVVSAGGCSTNCLANLAKVVHDRFVIEEALMTTIHAYTPSQKTVDGISAKNWRIGRGAFQNIIPTSTSVATSIGKIIPSLEGKLTGMALRVPVADCSVIDLTVRLRNGSSLADIRRAYKDVSEDKVLGRYIGYIDDEMVSSDFIGDTHSAVFDASASIALHDNFVKLISWYDNEYGYCCRLIDFISYVASRPMEQMVPFLGCQE